MHVPHSSAEVPADVRPQFLLADDDLARELRFMTDWHTDELFALPPDVAVTIRFPVSRLVVDPERFEDPEAERMEAVGMGAVYTKTSQALPPDVAVTIRFPVSRLVVDPERFEDPEAERMEAVGMGAVYTKTSQGLPL